MDASGPKRQPAAADAGPHQAAKNVVMMNLALLQAEIANRLYKNPMTELAKEFHYEPLPWEVRGIIIAAWQRGGLLPASVVKRIAAAISPS